MRFRIWKTIILPVLWLWNFFPFTRSEFWLACLEVRGTVCLEASGNCMTESFVICTPRQILGRLRCHDMCAECSMHGGEENCTQSFRKQKIWTLIFHYLRCEKFRRKYAWDIPGNICCVITILCIGLTHHVLQPHSLMNAVTVGHRIKKNIYIYPQEPDSFTYFLYQFLKRELSCHKYTNKHLYTSRSSINTEVNMAAIPRFVCVINLVR